MVSIVVAGTVVPGVGVGVVGPGVPVQPAPRAAARTRSMGMRAILPFIREGWDCAYLRIVPDHKSVIEGGLGEAGKSVWPGRERCRHPGPYRKSFNRGKETVFS